jgi:hypothetical protein
MTERQVQPTTHFTVFRSASEENIERLDRVASIDDGGGASRVDGPNWALMLSVSMMRTLEYRLPGFTADVQKRLAQSAARMEVSSEQEHRADATSVHDLLGSWVFSEALLLAEVQTGDPAASV